MAKKYSHRFLLDNFPGDDSFSSKLKQASIDHGWQETRSKAVS